MFNALRRQDPLPIPLATPISTTATMEKIPKTWSDSFYGAEMEDYEPRRQQFAKKDSPLPAAPVASTLPKELLPLKADCQWIDCFYPQEEELVTGLVPTVEAGSDYVPPSWSNEFVGTAAAEQRALRELARAAEIRADDSDDSEKDTFFLVDDEALQKRAEVRFAALPVNVLKREPPAASRKSQIRFDPEAFERELPNLLVTYLPLVESSEPSTLASDSLDDDFCNVNDLLPLEAVERFLDNQTVSPASSVGKKNDPEPVSRESLEDVANRVKANCRPRKRAIEIEMQSMPTKKTRESAEKEPNVKARIVERRSNKPPKVKQYVTQEAKNKFNRDVAKAKEVLPERLNCPRAKVGRKKPTYTGELYLIAYPAMPEQREEGAPQLHLR